MTADAERPFPQDQFGHHGFRLDFCLTSFVLLALPGHIWRFLVIGATSTCRIRFHLGAPKLLFNRSAHSAGPTPKACGLVDWFFGVFVAGLCFAIQGALKRLAKWLLGGLLVVLRA